MNFHNSFIYLMRHAEAQATQLGQSDHNRPLSQRGIIQAQEVGQKIIELGLEPDIALVSSALRTQQSFRNLQLPSELLKNNFDSLYSGNVDDYFALLHQQSVTSALLVGHNPTISHILQILIGKALCEFPANFSTATLAVIGFPTSLQNIKMNSGTLIEFFAPQS